MFTLLAPAALVGLSLLAIPIVIHLLKPRKVRRTPFSSLRWLHLTQQRLSRRLRWHQLWLFLLRAAFITLLVLAVAKPMWSGRSADGPRERFVVLDVSRSMGYRNGDRPTPLEVGRHTAAALLAAGDADDRTALITVGATAKILGVPAAGGEQYAARLASVEPESTDTDFGAALDAVRTLLGRPRPDTQIELFLITDGQRNAWRPGAVEALVAEFPDRVSCTVVNAAEAGAQNGWIADARFLPAEAGLPPAIDVQLLAVGAGTERTVRLTGAAGLNERSQVVVLDPARPTDVRFELPADFDPRGKTCEVVLDPPDGLPTDDRWYLSFEATAALDVLVVEGPTAPAAATSPGFALRTALDSLSTAEHRIHVTTKKHAEVEPRDFAAVDAVLLADAPELADDAGEALTERVRNGAGLGIFLGPAVDAEFYNRRLIDPLDRSKSLLPLRLERVVDVPLASGGLAAIEAVDADHPLLAGLLDPTLGDLGRVGVRTHYRFAAAAPGAANVVATADADPFLFEHSAGQGKVVVVNTTADDAWSDLPRRKSFVPLVDRLLDHLSGGALRRTFTTGEAVALAIRPLAAGESVAVIAPGGEVLTPTVTTIGNRTRLNLPPLAVPGVYRLRIDGGAESNGNSAGDFIVQVGRGDSDLAPVETDALTAWWKPASVEVVTPASGGGGSANAGASLVVWCALLAALLLAVETLVVSRLCPRMLPRVAESIVGRRPIVAAGPRVETPESSFPPTARPA